MKYVLGSESDFKNAPPEATVRLKHDDGREFFAVERDLGATFWYLTSEGEVSGSSMPMGAAIFKRTAVIARRLLQDPKANWATSPVESPKKPEHSRTASALATQEKEKEAARVRQQRASASDKADRISTEVHFLEGHLTSMGVPQNADDGSPLSLLGRVKEYVAAERKHAATCESVPKADPGPAKPEAIKQVGGQHYDSMPVDVMEFCEVNGLGFVESTAIKYIARRKGESRIEDLRKAINCIERIIKHEETGSWAR